MKSFVPLSVTQASRREDEWPLEAYDLKPGVSLDDLSGHVFVVAPLPPGEKAIAGERAFANGDGMVYRLSFAAGKVMLKTRMAKTPCYYADLVAQYGKPFKRYAFRDGGVPRLTLQLGSRNQLNTAFQKTANRLLITYDAGRPYTFDPEAMEVVEPVGKTKDWIMIFFGLLPVPKIFQIYSGSAHPVADPPTSNEKGTSASRDTFIVNYSSGYSGRFRTPVNRVLNALFKRINQLKQTGKVTFGRNRQQRLSGNERWGSFTDLIRWQSDGSTERWRLVLPKDNSTRSAVADQPVDLSNHPPVVIQQSVHQMGLTEDYVILGDLQFGLEYSQIFSPFYLGWLSTDWFTSQWFSQPLGAKLYSIFLQLFKSTAFTDFYVVRRADLTAGGQADEPPQFVTATRLSLPRTVSHFAVDYSNADNKLVFHVGHHNGLDPTEWINRYDLPVKNAKSRHYLRHDLQGLMVGTTDLGSFYRYEFDAKTGALLSSKGISEPGSDQSKANSWLPSVYTHRDLQVAPSDADPSSAQVNHIYWMSWGFSWELIPQRIYDAYKEREYREIPVANLPSEDLPPTLLRLDTEQMTIADAYAFPQGYAAFSPQYIPSKTDASELAGYISCVVLADDPEQADRANDEFWIFKAGDLKAGPVCRLRHAEKLNLGLTLHSTWLSEADFEQYRYSAAERRQKREKTVHEDYDEAVYLAGNRSLPRQFRRLIRGLNNLAATLGRQKTVRELFDEWIYPHFVEQTLEESLKTRLQSQMPSQVLPAKPEGSEYSASVSLE
ncbi:MAG: carotenoid oxygenase family protein [Synechococcales cyanobacterium C42_A2020_086]|jgi:hypothetical protein|nr:carotenoid oxygenase family protein [Synechococcales cyanobacterium C42_A2020_086]